MKILIDTNVILDLLDSDRPGFLDSFAFYDKLILDNNHTACAYMDALSTISFITSKRNKDTFSILDTLIDDFEIIDATVKDAKKAIELHQSGILHNDFEDGQLLALAAALRNPTISAIVTNDKDFLSIREKVEIDIISPAEALITAGYEKRLTGEWEPKDKMLKTLEMQAKLKEEKK